ncbi:esterase FE4-like [Pogonomyrmex barbatus]|uniref:Esterase FE4-like n=1 Tax=Pogonomyrmex barbatus TaxID=144034 RepID=A0A6I9W257_9HYME|nr:esterase FE4-like [Pogonomyrmex barbatus]
MRPHEFLTHCSVSARCLCLNGRIWRYLWVLVYLLSLAVAFNSSQPPIINTKWGLFRGKWSWSVPGNRPIANFLGIPYAQPPVGELRFRSPQQWNNTWMKIRDATIDGQKCIQITNGTKIVGSEDCLYLNIFIPDILEIRQRSQNLPVLVFIHPGIFKGGSSDSKLYAPDYLLNHDVILVTLNYRLSALGFFSTMNEVSPGNYGIKDVKMALEWIQENIHSFNGDRRSVTLMGLSAGAAATHILALSKKTEGLFDKYILHSGTALHPWSFHPPRKYRQVCLKLAKLVGCLPKRGNGMNDTIDKSSEENNGSSAYDDVLYSSYTIKDDEEIMSCMRKVDARKILNMTQSFHVWENNPQAVFGPTLELDSEDAILTMHPLKIIKEGLFRDMPAIMQVVKDEGLVKTTNLIINRDVRTEFIENFEEYFLYFAEYENVVSNTKMFTSAIQDFYCKGNITTTPMYNITEMASDALIMWSVFQTLQYQSKKANSSIYFSFFAYEGTFSHTYSTGIPIYYGVCHGDDMNYFFPILNNMFPDLLLHNTEYDKTMINIVTEMWTSFAKKGIPRTRLVPEWPDYHYHHKFMRFGIGKAPEIVVQSDFLPDRMAFWEKLMSNVSIPIDVFIVPSKDTVITNNANAIDRELIVTLIVLSMIILS